MNRLVRGMLVLVILAGTVLIAGSTARADVPDEWKSLDIAGLTTLARQFRAKGAAGVDDCKLLATYVAKRYTTDAAADKVDYDEWLDLTLALSSYFSGDTRTAMCGNLKQKFASNDEAICNNSSKWLAQLVRLFDYLGDDEAAQSICTKWVCGSDKYKAATAYRLSLIAPILGSAGQTGKVARQKLAEHIKATYLKNKTSTQSVKLKFWRNYTTGLAKAVSADDRRLWAKKICEAFAGTPDAMSGLKKDELEYLVLALNKLDSGREIKLAVTLVTETTVWQSLNPRGLSYLADFLSKAGLDVKVARKKLAGHVKAKYLKDKTATQSVPIWRWRHFVGSLNMDVSGTDRQLWFDRLREAFAGNDKDIGALSARNFRYLTESMVLLDHKQTATIVLVWFNANKGKGFDSASTGDLAHIVYAGQGDRPGAAPAANEFETIWLARNSKEPLKLNDSILIVKAWLAINNKTKAQQWAMRAYENALGTEQARASADATTLKTLGRWLRETGLTGKGKGYPKFAAVLARLAKAGKLPADKWWRYKFYAATLGTAAARQTLQAEVSDANGNPRQVVATILAYAYRHKKEDFQTWQTFLDGKIATAGMSGDTKARWLLAKAFAEAIVNPSGNPKSPIRGKKWLDQALATATSASCRLEVLQKFVEIYRGMRRPAIAVSLLESVKGQFSGAGLAQVETMLHELRAEQADSDVSFKRRQAADEIARKKGRLAYYRKRLAVYQARGDADKVAQLQAAIEKLEQGLQP